MFILVQTRDWKLAEVLEPNLEIIYDGSGNVISNDPFVCDPGERFGASVDISDGKYIIIDPMF